MVSIASRMSAAPDIRSSSHVIKQGRHSRRDAIIRTFRVTMTELGQAFDQGITTFVE